MHYNIDNALTKKTVTLIGDPPVVGIVSEELCIQRQSKDNSQAVDIDTS